MLVSIPFAEHLKYLEYVMRHKYYVFLECKRLGIPLQVGKMPEKTLADDEKIMIVKKE